MIVWKDRHTTIFKSALYETNSAVVITDDCVVIADPCWLPNEVEQIRHYVENNRGNRPLYLLFTHSDFDHLIGYKAFPDAIVIASEALHNKSHREKEDIVEQMKEFDDQYYITRNYEIQYPVVDQPIAGEETILRIGGTTLTFFQAPGHTNDGLFTVIEPSGVFLAGDYFSDIEFPFIYDDSKQYEKTIRKLDDILANYSLKLLVTGHGNAASDTLDMKKRQNDALHYIQTLRKMVIEKDQTGLERLIAGSKFPRNMEKCHQQNILQLEKELNRYSGESLEENAD